MLRKNFIFLLSFLSILAVVYFDFGRGFEFSPIDEHGFVDTILNGQVLPLMILPENGRFAPFAGLEYNLLVPFGVKSANVFHLISLLELFGLALVLFSFYHGQKRKFLAGFCFLFFLPGVQVSFARLIGLEKMSLFFLTTFFYLYLKDQKTKFENLLMMVVGTISIYYKETNFVLVGIPAFIDLVHKIRFKKEGAPWNLFLLLQCLIYLCVYYFFIFSKVKGAYHSELHDGGPLDKFVKYCISDPLILLSPLIIYFGGWTWERVKENALIIAVMVFLLEYLVLGMYSQYLMTPAYAAVLMAAATVEFKKPIKIGFVGLFVTFYFFSAISAFFYWREMPRSMVESIKQLKPKHPQQVMFADFENGPNNYEWVVAYEQFYGFYNQEPVKVIFGSSASVKDETPSILTPIHSYNLNYSAIDSGPWYFPDLCPRTLIKYFLIRSGYQGFKNYDVFQNPHFYILSK